MDLALIFDTETTGLPKRWDAPLRDLNNWPRVIELGWQLADLSTGQVIKEKNIYIKPDGWKIPLEADLIAQGFAPEVAKKESKFWVDNGFTMELLEEKGQPLSDVLDDFITDYERSKVLVAHNMSYDHNVLGAEMLRYSKKAKVVLPKVCTKERSTDVCRIPGKFKGQYKWPSLMEAHIFFTGKPFENAHGTGPDTTACRVVFFNLLMQRHITPKIWTI